MRSPRSVTTRQRPVLAVDRFDRGAGAVLDAEGVVVAEADDPVAGRELGPGDGEALAAEAAVAVHQRAGERVELGDVAAAERDHDVPGRSSRAAAHQSASKPRLRRRPASSEAIRRPLPSAKAR